MAEFSGVLERDSLLRAMEAQWGDDALLITPLLDVKQVGAASIDLRLGHEFIVLKRSVVAAIDPGQLEIIEENIHRTQEKIRFQRGEAIVLHPQEFVLAATLEYVCIPKSMEGTITGRSTWGRSGLTVVTASQVAPGFKGCPTLEIVHHGQAPIVLYPGVRICQLTIRTLHGQADYEATGRYRYPTGPQFPRIGRDVDLEYLTRKPELGQ